MYGCRVASHGIPAGIERSGNPSADARELGRIIRRRPTARDGTSGKEPFRKVPYLFI